MCHIIIILISYDNDDNDDFAKHGLYDHGKNDDSVIHRLNDLDLYDGNDDNDDLVTKQCYDSDHHDDYAPCYKFCNISALEHSFVEKTTPFSTISTTRRKGACTLRSL